MADATVIAVGIAMGCHWHNYFLASVDVHIIIISTRPWYKEKKSTEIIHDLDVAVIVMMVVIAIAVNFTVPAVIKCMTMMHWVSYMYSL